METEFIKDENTGIAVKLRFNHCWIEPEWAIPPFKHIVATVFIPPICKKCGVFMSKKVKRWLPPDTHRFPSKIIEVHQCPKCGCTAPINDSSRIINIPITLKQ